MQTSRQGNSWNYPLEVHRNVKFTALIDKRQSEVACLHDAILPLIILLQNKLLQKNLMELATKGKQKGKLEVPTDTRKL